MAKRISLLLLCVSGLLLPACEEKHETPEATIVALRTSVQEGRADRIPNYIYADSPDTIGRSSRCRTGAITPAPIVRFPWCAAVR